MSFFYSTLFSRAHAAGMAAGQAAKVVGMTVYTPKSLFDDTPDLSQPVYYEPEGVCGFAWIKIKGNTAFARWAKAAGKARPGYPGGLDIPVHGFDQSMQRKEAYAYAFAKVLNDAGIKAYAESRID